MPDDADMANDHIEKELVQRIAAARKIWQPKDSGQLGLFTDLLT